MASKQDLKQLACLAIEARANELIKISQTILSNPETGYRETKTSALVADWFQSAGLRHRKGIAKTGIVAEIESGKPGHTVAVFGELDSLIVPGHAFADARSGAAHACGHHIQIGSMLGVAVGLLAPGVLEALSGRVKLMAVPAEEGIEIEHRLTLRDSNEIEFISGKQEFVRLGEMDHVDIAMMTHASTYEPYGFGMYEMNGNVKKNFHFIGHAAHAGSQPEQGINALNAAALAISAIHAQRETFRDKDNVRVHPIITRGGSAVNSVPADVRMETYVRASNMDALKDAAAKVDRAVRAGAMAVGAKVRIITVAGTLPSRWDQSLAKVWSGNAAALVGPGEIRNRTFSGGSTDMGDISHLIPSIHPFVYAATGTGHGADYLVKDYHLAVIKSAQAMAMTVIDLLGDGGAEAAEVARKFKPSMSRADYLTLLRAFATDRTYADS